MPDLIADSDEPETPMVWVDLETTGLVPTEDLILEIGFRLTSWDGSDEIARFTSLVHSPGWRERLGLGDNRPAFEIHSANGLINDLEEAREQVTDGDGISAPPDVREVELKALAWLDEYHIPNGLPLAGSSNATDRYFLLNHMPALAQRFSYRTLDVSGVREACRVTSPRLFTLMEEHFEGVESRHRVQECLNDSIALWQWLIDEYLMV